MKTVRSAAADILKTFCVLAAVALDCVAASRACLAADAPAPLLDRGVFFAEPEIVSARVSPDGKFLAFLKPLGARQNIWLKRTDQPLTTARPVTAVDDHSPDAFYWSMDSRCSHRWRRGGSRLGLPNSRAGRGASAR
jgi:hypothetical protein